MTASKPEVRRYSPERTRDHYEGVMNADPDGYYVELDDYLELEAARAADKARIAELVEALRAFKGAACPCAAQIDPKGYSWSGAYLDEALKIAAPLLAQQGKEGE